MRKYFELYNHKKTYYSPIGELFTPEEVGKRYAIVNSGLPVVIETDADHIIFAGYGLLSQYKALYNIDDSLSDEEALNAIIEKANEMEEQTQTFISPEERIASALEYQNLMSY